MIVLRNCYKTDSIKSHFQKTKNFIYDIQSSKIRFINYNDN